MANSTDKPFVIENTIFRDDRGYFQELYRFNRQDNKFKETRFVQDNVSLSKIKGTVRGLHMQCLDSSQTKIVSCIRGKIFDVAIDARPSSKNYGRHYTIELCAELGNQFYIPAGFLHGFQTLTDDCMVFYKCSQEYNPFSEVTVKWNDQDLSVPWPFPYSNVFSEKDSAGIAFKKLAAVLDEKSKM